MGSLISVKDYTALNSARGELLKLLEQYDVSAYNYFKGLKYDTQLNIIDKIFNNKNFDITKLDEELYSDEFYLKPPTIEEYLENEYFLGTAGRDIYPKWKDVLTKEIFSVDKDTLEVIFTGAIGIGKTKILNVAMSYVLCKVLCLKNPAKILGIMGSDSISFGFFNITKELTHRVNYSPFYNLLFTSPFFIERISNRDIKSGKLNPDKPFPDFNVQFALGSGAIHALGQNTLCAILDEANFAKGAGLDKSAIEHTMETYQAVQSRISSRYEAKIGIFYHYFLMMIASSKKYSNDFVDAHIEKQKTKKTTVILDFKEWEVKPSDTYKMRNEDGSQAMFKVLVGDKLIKSRILEDAEVLPPDTDFNIVEVPLDLKHYFEYDLEQAIMDRAGISVSYLKKFIPREDLIKKIFTHSIKENPFYGEQVECSLGSSSKLQDFFNAKAVCYETQYGYYPINNPNMSRFIHVDLSKNGDFTGLAMGHFGGYKQSLMFPNIQYPSIHIDFVIRLDYKGSEIDYEKIRSFILYLDKSLNFKIKAGGKVTYDGFQSTDSIQLFIKSGFASENLSMDKSNLGYDTLKTSILAEFIECHNHLILANELINLEKTNTGKIDHPVKNMDGSKGTKDCADAVAGVVQLIIEEYPPLNTDSETFMESFERINLLVEDDPKLKTLVIMNSVDNSNLADYELD